MGEIELLLGAGDAHIGEPPLLLHLLGRIHALRPGEDALLHSRDEHHREFEALGGVHRHQHHGVGLGVVVVDIGHQRHFLQKAGERGVFVFVFIGHKVRDKLRQVVDALLSLVGVGLEKAEVLRALDNLLEQFVEMHRIDLFVQLRDQIAKLHQPPGGTRQRFVFVGVGDHFKQTDAEARRNFKRAVDRRVADPAFGHVDDPAQTDVVVGIVDHGQIGQRVLDFGAFIKPEAADHTIRDTGAHHGAFNGVRLRVHAVEHSVVAEGEFAACHVVFDGLGDKVRLILFVKRGVFRHAVAGAVFGPKVFALAVFVVGNHFVRHVQDRLGRTVVLLETDQRRVFILRLEVQDVFDCGTAEAVGRCSGRRRRPRRCCCAATRAVGSAGTGRGWCPDIRPP